MSDEIKNFRFQINDDGLTLDMMRDGVKGIQERGRMIRLHRPVPVEYPVIEDLVLTSSPVDADKAFYEWYQGVLGEARQARIINVPASWFQRFKERRFPRWLLRWFPVKYANLKGDIVSFKELKGGNVEMVMEVNEER